MRILTTFEETTMEDLARKIDALEQKVIASSGTMERTAKMLRLTTSSLVDAYDLPQEHFPFMYLSQRLDAHGC